MRRIEIFRVLLLFHTFLHTRDTLLELGITSSLCPAHRAFHAAFHNLVGANRADEALVAMAAARELAIGHILEADYAGVVPVRGHRGFRSGLPVGAHHTKRNGHSRFKGITALPLCHRVEWPEGGCVRIEPRRLEG